MVIIEQNKNGRVYIDQFEIKRLSMLFLKENFPSIKDLFIGFDGNKMKLNFSNDSNLNIDDLGKIRHDLIIFLQTNVHFDLKQLDINVI